jgi:hypothetical protein
MLPKSSPYLLFGSGTAIRVGFAASLVCPLFGASRTNVRHFATWGNSGIEPENRDPATGFATDYTV